MKKHGRSPFKFHHSKTLPLLYILIPIPIMCLQAAENERAAAGSGTENGFSSPVTDNRAARAGNDPEVEIRATPAHLIAAGNKSEMKISVSKNRTPLKNISFQVILPDETLIGQTDENGGARVTINIKKSCRVRIQLPPPYNNFKDLFTDAMDSKTYAGFDETAKRVHARNAVHTLFIGDSLSDFHRGENYIDKLDFWLNLYNPGKFSFRNAGVRGDYIVKALKRLTENVPPSYRPEMYKDLFIPTPDIVFIFLGHNDTKLSSESNYQEPLVSVDAQMSAFRDVTAHIRKHCGARIVLISPMSLNYSVCKAGADKLKAENKKHSLFGSPGQLEKFDCALKKTAEREKLEYIDVYTPSKNHPDKAGLFSPADGVHLSPAGERFLAVILLGYFAEDRAVGNPGGASSALD
jgi:lysophospholipase L1-like esterase